ncbi:MAG TPA: hypothetical protein VFQ53_16050 [Kofleriaceae bacterium]|nr:hypothetical protein [Kofleriaceae bacterium]
MRLFTITLVLAACARLALAAPAAEVIVVWAPGASIGPIQRTAKQAGAAVIDRSPAPPSASDLAPLVQRGIAAYDALKFDDSRATLELARDRADRTGAAGLSTAQLSDLFLYRGLVAAQGEDPSQAWDELVVAMVIGPTRVLDPARFPPRVIEQLERARKAVGERPRVPLRVDAPAGCTILVDGAPATEAPVIAGPHWVRVACADHTPWGTRVEVTAPSTTLAARPTPLAPPSDADVLVQARVSGARAVIVAEVRGDIATARLIGLDGRERDRRAVTVHGDLAPLAQTIEAMLHPEAAPRWYRSKWAWAAGAAAIAAAVLIPVTAAVSRDRTPTDATLSVERPPGW